MTRTAVKFSFNGYGIIRDTTLKAQRSTRTAQQHQLLLRTRTGPTRQDRRSFTTRPRRLGQSDGTIRGSQTTQSSTRVTAATNTTLDRIAAKTTTTTTTTGAEDKTAPPAPDKEDMASDEDYMAFLNKANNDADEAHAKAAETVRAQSGARAQLKALDAGSTAPQPIVDVCKEAVYTSDADEPFHQVSLKWSGEGGLPDEEEFAKLINHWDAPKADISIMDPLDWDSNGQYTNVIEAVRKASKGNDVRVYKVVRDETRVEYWVITRDEDRIVGAKALAIES